MYSDPSGQFCLPCLIAILIALGVITTGCSDGTLTPEPIIVTSEPLMVDFWIAKQELIPPIDDNVHLYIDFSFRPITGEPEDFAIVQFVKGWNRRISDGQYANALIQNTIVKYDFPDWIIDSPGIDPVYWSTDVDRWNYHPIPFGSSTPDHYSFSDAPEVSIGYEVSDDFKTCILAMADVPLDGRTVNPNNLMAKAIKCLDWEFKVSYTDNDHVIVK